MRTSITALASLLALTPSVGAGGVVQVSPRFAVAELTAPGGGRSGAGGMNEKGQVVGSVDARAVLWTDGHPTYLVGPDRQSGATGINDNEQVLVTIRDDEGKRGSREETPCEPEAFTGRSFLWEKGRLTDLKIDTATALNNAGQIVGVGIPGKQHAVLWEKGRITDLGTRGVESGFASFAFGINARGQVVGFSTVDGGQASSAFLWEDGRAITFGGKRTQPQAINDAGHIVGTDGTSSSEYHAFLRRDGRMLDLGQVGRARGSMAAAVNGRDQVVGMALTVGVAIPHAFLWEDGRMLDLNDEIPAGPGWVLETATDINNRGQIVGMGRFRDQPRGFLLTPK